MEFSTSITDILKLHRSILTDLQKRLGSSQGSITLTTSGSSGASTLIGNSLNIPVYSSGATASWGSITGTLASQTDLNTALLAKVTGNSSITGATKTKITYDSKGLVTSGADATTADIADSLNKRYVTDAQQTIIGNTSGTNTGDNATNSQYSGLAASKQDTLVSGTNIKTINSTTLLGSGNITTGSVTSVGVSMPTAFSVASSPITTSGTIAITGAGVVSQYVRGDGTLANFPNSTGGGSSVNYYLNGSVSQGTFGGDTYYEMSKTPILGAGTNFTRTNGAGNGYIASFITDAGDPSFLNIPGGNWNVEFYFQSSSTGGSPQFYGEIYKVSATNVFTLVASGSANPESITNGTTVDQYFTSIPVPQTSLLITDRLAIRIYVITSGRTITLHTENGNLCEVLTTFTTGLTALNGLTQQVQNLAVGTSGTDFSISSATDTHTFNLPDASATNRGALTSANWSTFNGKQNALNITNLTDVGTDGITITNGTGCVIGTSAVTIAQQKADATHNGYLSSGDWVNFNGKGTVTSIATGTGLTGGTITGSGTISFSTAAVGTWAATPSSANLAAAMTDETGSGSLVFGTSPTFTNSITVNGSTISGYNTTPLEGAIKDGVTSILGDLSTWTTSCYQGTVLYSETSSTTIAFGQLCYRTNAGQWGLADATSFAASAYYMLGICLKTTTGPSQPTSILINGFVESTYVADFKVGEPQYMATTAGSMTKSAPASSGNIVRIIGNTFWTTALQTNAKCVLHFNPDKTWIELT